MRIDCRGFAIIKINARTLLEIIINLSILLWRKLCNWGPWTICQNENFAIASLNQRSCSMWIKKCESGQKRVESCFDAVTQSFELKWNLYVSWMIRRAIRTGSVCMHRCTRGCVVLFRGTTGVGTHGLPTRSRVSDLTRRVIDAAIFLAAEEVFMPPLHLSRLRDGRLRRVWWCYRQDLSHAFRGYGRTNAFGSRFASKRKKRNRSLAR